MITTVGETQPSDHDSLSHAAALLKGFSDPTRLSILRRLVGGETRVVDLTRHLQLPQSTVSSHLSCLRECGLVEMEPRGRSSVYSLAHPEILQLLAAAEDLAAKVGPAVSLCPRTLGNS